MGAPITTYTLEQWFGPLSVSDLGDDLEADLTSSQCFIPLDIAALRIIDANEIAPVGDTGDGSSTSDSGLLASDTNPRLERVDGAGGDDCLRVTWTAAADEIEVQFPPTPLPPDLDEGENLIFRAMVSRSGTTDDCQVDVRAYETVVGAYADDVEMGDKWVALSGVADEIEEVTVTLDHTDISGHPSVLNLALVPDAHTTDDLYLYAAWLEYTRAMRTS